MFFKFNLFSHRRENDRKRNSNKESEDNKRNNDDTCNAASARGCCPVRCVDLFFIHRIIHRFMGNHKFKKMNLQPLEKENTCDIMDKMALTKVFVDCKIAFTDEHCDEVPQRKPRGGAYYFRLSQDAKRYTLDFHLNTESATVQKDCVVVRDLGICASVEVNRLIGTMTKRTFGFVIVPIFMPPSFDSKASQSDLVVPATLHTITEMKCITATFHFVTNRQRSWFVEGFSLDIDARDMLEFVENVDQLIKQCEQGFGI